MNPNALITRSFFSGRYVRYVKQRRHGVAPRFHRAVRLARGYSHVHRSVPILKSRELEHGDEGFGEIVKVGARGPPPPRGYGALVVDVPKYGY